MPRIISRRFGDNCGEDLSLVCLDMEPIYHLLAGLSALAAFWWRFASAKKEDTPEWIYYVCVSALATVVILGNELRKWLLILRAMIL